MQDGPSGLAARMRRWGQRWVPLLALGLVVAASATRIGTADSTQLRVPVQCSRGPGEHKFDVGVRLPASAPVGTTFEVRIDGAPSGELSNMGLKYIFDMRTSYRIPPPWAYVPGSLRIVPKTGTANVREGARTWNEGRILHLRLPARVERGSGYTPPSLVFQVKAVEAGPATVVQLDTFTVKAKVLLLGSIETVCHPTPRPYGLAKLHVRSSE